MKRALILSGGGSRGAFQAGVWKYLQEIGWQPDLICGSSVGAVNAVAIGCGVNAEQLTHLWSTYNRTKFYNFAFSKAFLTFLNCMKFHPIMDTAPLRAILTEHIDIDALRKSKSEVLITAVNLTTSKLTYFDKNVITIDHIMAAAALPLLFPWQYINGEPFWDGGLMANVPIGPALELDIEEIILVLLSPVTFQKFPLPHTPHQVLELILEQFIIGSYQAVQGNLQCKNANLITIAPTSRLGIFSMLNFSPRQSKKLVQEGYENAKKEVGNLKFSINPKGFQNP